LGVTVVGTGSGFSADFFRGMTAAYLISSNADVEILYPETSEKIAGCVIKHGLENCNASSTADIPRNVDFAGITEPFPTSDYTSATDLQLFPLAFGAVVPVINLPFLALGSAPLTAQSQSGTGGQKSGTSTPTNAPQKSGGTLPLNQLQSTTKPQEPIDQTARPSTAKPQQYVKQDSGPQSTATPQTSSNSPHAPPTAGAFVLTPSILSGIFCGHITAWNHPSILSANKGFASQLNQLSFGDRKITVVVPSEQAPETTVWTSSLSGFNASFQHEVGISNNPNNPIWQHSFLRRPAGAGVASLVSSTVGSIGYMQMGIASLYQMYVPTLQTLPNRPVLTANLASIAFAGSELGSNFGNYPGDPNPSHYTASLINGPDLEAWPMTLYIYLAVRTKNGLNNDCQSQLAMAQMWYWYLSSPAARRIVENFGFSYLSGQVQNQVTATFKQVMCNGQLVFQSSAVSPTVVLVTPLLSSWFSFVSGAVTEIFHQASFSQVPSNGPIGSNHMSIQESVGVIAQSDASKSFIYLPLFGSAFVFVCNWPVNMGKLSSVVLDNNLISNLLSGSIQNWNDPRILSLNPFLKNVLGNTSHKIIFYKTGQSLSLQKSLLQSFGVTYPLNTTLTNTKSNTLQTLIAVAGTPFSIGFVPFTDKIKSFSLNVFSVMRNDGRVLVPAQSSFSECATDTLHLDPVIYYDLPASFNSNCYPLTFSYELVIKQDFSGVDCATPKSPGYGAASFVWWLLQRGNLQKMLATWDTVHSNFPLNGPDNVYRAIRQALLQIRCNGRSILLVEQNYNYISAWSVPLANAIFVIVACMGLFFLIWMVVFRREKAIVLSQPGFMLMFTVGVVTMTSSLIPLSMDDAGVSYYSLDGALNLAQNFSKLDSACRSIPWLYLTGCALEYSALLVKVVRLKRILLAKSYKKVVVTFWSMSPFLVGSLLVAWIICVVWTTHDPLHWHRVPVAFDQNGIMIESFGQCTSAHIGAFFWNCVCLPVCCPMFWFILVLCDTKCEGRLRGRKMDFCHIIKSNVNSSFLCCFGGVSP